MALPPVTRIIYILVMGQKRAGDPDFFWGWDIWDLDVQQNDHQLYLLILSSVIWADSVPQVFSCQADQTKLWKRGNS